MSIQPIEFPVCIFCRNEKATYFIQTVPNIGIPSCSNCIQHIKQLLDDNVSPEELAPGVQVTSGPKVTHIQMVKHESHIGNRSHKYNDSDDCGICRGSEPGWRWWNTEQYNEPV